MRFDVLMAHGPYLDHEREQALRANFTLIDLPHPTVHGRVDRGFGQPRDIGKPIARHGGALPELEKIGGCATVARRPENGGYVASEERLASSGLFRRPRGGDRRSIEDW